jgi:drug/metabolite transporter (DMT)-like permease
MSFWRALPGNIRGAVLLAMAALVLTVETVLLRFVSAEVPVTFYTLARAVAQLALGALLVLSLGEGWRGARTRRPGMQLFRGFSSLVSWQLYYFSFRVLDFAVATTLNFTTGLFVALLAAPSCASASARGAGRRRS